MPLAPFLRQILEDESAQWPHNEALSERDIERIADAVRETRTLQTLEINLASINDGQVAPLAKALGQSATVTALNLSGNFLGNEGAECIAQAIETATALKVVALYGNGIRGAGCKALGGAIGRSKTLEEIDLGGNAFEGRSAFEPLAAGVRASASLRVLHLGGNEDMTSGAVVVAEAVAQSKITTLDLDGCRLPTGFSHKAAIALSESATLEELLLGGNPLSDDGAGAIADLVSKSKTLRVLDLTGSYLSDDSVVRLAEAAIKCTTLEELNIAGAHVKQAGASALAGMLREAQSLKTLDIRGLKLDASSSDLATIMAGVSACATLETLQLTSNDLSVAAAAMVADAVAKCPRLHTLALGDCTLGDEGAGALEPLARCAALHTLVLFSNQIGDTGAAALAKILVQLNLLEVLRMEENEIGNAGAQAIAEALPATIKEFRLGECVMVSDAGAKAIGGLLARATGLKKLCLNANGIREDGAAALADGLAKSSSIEYLDLESNRLGAGGAAIIDAAARSTTLTTLKLGWTDIPTLPDSIGDCSSLRALHLEGNPVEELPVSFVKLEKTLRECNLERCEWTTPPEAIVDKGLSAVFSFLQALQDEGGLDCAHARLMLVGLGEVGKTSLQRALMSDGDCAEHITEDNRTVGIDTQTWKPDDDDFEFRVWDFAGQRIYYGTHQFFLSTRVLYVLVWRLDDRRGLRTTVHEWLDTIVARAPGASVVLVATHADAVPAEEADQQQAMVAAEVRNYVTERTAERGDRQKVLKVLRDGESLLVSCRTGSGIPAAREAIVGAGRALHHIGERIPKTWVAVRDAVHQLEEGTDASFLSLDQVRAACATVEPDTMMQALSLWHELGDIFVHEDLVAPSPQRVVDVLRAIVTHEISSEVRAEHAAEVRALEHSGRLSWDLAQVLLAPVAPGALHRALMHVLVQFDAIVELEEGGAWMVPVLAPAGAWDVLEEADWPMWAEGELSGHSAVLSFRFMPAGLFQRVCVGAYRMETWIAREFTATFARMRAADGTRLLIDLVEEGVDGRAGLALHGRGARSWDLVSSALKAARSLCEEFFSGSQCQVHRPNDAEQVRWDRVTADRFVVHRPSEAEAAAAQRLRTRQPLMMSYKHGGPEGALALKIREAFVAGGTGMWMDTEGITGGAMWRRQIADGIHGASVVVVALSTRSVQSPFCEEEVCLARRYGKPILPVLVSEEPRRADYRPHMLKLLETQWVSFMGGTSFDDAFAELSKSVMDKLQSIEAAAAAAAEVESWRTERAIIPLCPATVGESSLGAVFVAHSTADADVVAARRLGEWVERVAGAKSCSTMFLGQQIQSKVRQEAMADAMVVLVLVSRAFVASRACSEEIGALLGQLDAGGRSTTILPVVIENVPSGWAQKDLELKMARFMSEGVRVPLGNDDGKAAEAIEGLCGLVRSSLTSREDTVSLSERVRELEREVAALRAENAEHLATIKALEEGKQTQSPRRRPWSWGRRGSSRKSSPR